MFNSYMKFIINGTLTSALCIASSCYADVSPKHTPNSMPSCAAYRDIGTCNASKDNKGKGHQCMYLFSDTAAKNTARGELCQSINDKDTVDYYKNINVEEVAKIFPKLYKYDENSTIGNPVNNSRFDNDKRYAVVGKVISGYVEPEVSLKDFYELCVEEKDEETCGRIVFERNKDLMIRDAQNEDTDWSDKDTKAIQWDKLPEEMRSLITSELKGNEKDVTRILLQIKAKHKTGKQAAGIANAKEAKRQEALAQEKDNGKAEQYDMQCKKNTSGSSCRKASLSRPANDILDGRGVDCVWTHNEGVMAGGTCRYANAITCENLKLTDCEKNPATKNEINEALGRVGLPPMECNWDGKSCSIAG